MKHISKSLLLRYDRAVMHIINSKHYEDENRRLNQSGNILFYILIAVGLLGALSFAVSQSSRGGAGELDSERQRLLATEIIEYGNVMTNAVSQLNLRGIDDDTLCFDHAGWGASDYDHASCSNDFNKVFDINGAGLIWSNAPSDAMDASAPPDNLWHIYGDNEVEEVGSTCGDATCADLILVVDELRQAVCIKINDLLGVENPAGIPPTDTSYGEARFTGAYSYTATIGDEAGGAAIKGRQSGCFQNTTSGHYAFFKILRAR